MMKLLRNPEVGKTVVVYMVVSVLAVTVSFVWDLRFGLLMTAVCGILLCIYLFTTNRRYERICELAADVNKILHGDEHVSLEKYSEGELGILHSEVYKMTVRLREQQQKLQEDKIYLADSLADISHQIRTPLTSINLLVSLLSEEGITKERRQKLSQELQGMLFRIEWLITSLLKISKLDAGTVSLKQENIPLEEFIQKAAEPLLVPMELHGIDFHVTAQGTFSGDILWTCEAVSNIIKNCMEHTPDGGRIEITGLDNVLYTEIVISDTGSGIAPQDLPHIFERFYKGEDCGEKGFGIGLFLARAIITAQNGTVKAENQTSKGAKFTIRFYKGTV